MISESTLRSVQLLIRCGNLFHCLPFEWSEKRRGLQTLEYDKKRWKLIRSVISIHISIRIILMVIGLLVVGVGGKKFDEVLLVLFFVSAFILTISFCFEVLFRPQEVVTAFNTTLCVNDMMGKRHVIC